MFVGLLGVCSASCPLVREIPEGRTVPDPSCLHPPGPAQRCSVHVWLNEGTKGLWVAAVASVAICVSSCDQRGSKSRGEGLVVRVAGRFHGILLFSPVKSGVCLGGPDNSTRGFYYQLPALSAWPAGLPEVRGPVRFLSASTVPMQRWCPVCGERSPSEWSLRVKPTGQAVLWGTEINLTQSRSLRCSQYGQKETDRSA